VGRVRNRRVRHLRAPLIVLVALVALAAAACSGGSSSSPGGSSSSGSGGTVTVAYLPGTQPVDIFPLFPSVDDTTQEIFWFIEQFWRPLYWFGQGGSLNYNPALSLAEAPKFSNDNKTVSITLKNWKWSDGKPITTADVRFYLNLLTADKTQYANYVPGYFPDNLASVSYPSSRTFVLNFKQAYSSNWLFLNQLCLLFALPQHAWDKTSAGGKIGNYDETTAGAKAVFSFLSDQAKDLATYATNPLWQVVDGPFRISSYQPNSEVTMVPNKEYSGPVKPRVAKVQFLDFTSDAAEYNQLLSGNVDYGYVPFNDVPSEGRLKSQGYSIVPWEQAGMNYAVYNFTNPSTGPLFKQLYIRQAIQHTVDQQTMISSALYGDGVLSYGAVPAYKPAPEVNGQPLADAAAQQDTYPYSIATAISLLRSHGWSVHAGGTDTCSRPGSGPSDCGAGIAAGQALSFKFEYPTGVIQDSVEAQLLQGDAAKAGIHVSDTPVPTSVTFADSLCTKGTKCTWDSDYYYLGGWQYGVPINYPIGTLIFGCGGPYVGGYCSPKLDDLMHTAETTQQVSALYPYEEYLNQNLPVLWLPLQPYQFSAIKSSLHGATPQNLGFWINPENWTLSG
jgi:peptide/nickel transport system substrate-binding protein